VSGYPFLSEVPWLSVTVSFVAGCLGAATAEFVVPAVTSEGKEPWADARARILIAGWLTVAVSFAGFISEQPWAGGIATAAAISAGADALMLAKRWGDRARAAEQAREDAADRLQTATRTYLEQIEGLRQAVLGSYAIETGSDGFAELRKARFERHMNDVFAMARRATAAAGDATSLWEQVRAILQRRLSIPEVDEIALGDAGGFDPGVRKRIANDIARRWPDLKPEWSLADVTPESTLASLVNEIDGRSL